MNFISEERPSDAPFIESIWQTQSEQAGDFISVAATHSEIVIAKYAGKVMVTMRGPETRATIASAPPDGEFLGIVFKLGTFMPTLLPKSLKDRKDVSLPVVSNRSFWLESSAWEIPNFENADTFVERLVREGLLKYDPIVSAVLQGYPPTLSPRTLQYRFVRATGLSHKMIQQIDRAQHALTLLQQGESIIDTAYSVGYFDQSHLTNALKRFLGQTPAQIAPTQPDK